MKVMLEICSSNLFHFINYFCSKQWNYISSSLESYSINDYFTSLSSKLSNIVLHFLVHRWFFFIRLGFPLFFSFTDNVSSMNPILIAWFRKSLLLSLNSFFFL